MAFGMMETAEREATVISGAAFAGVGKRDVLAFVIADPLTAALGLDEVFGFSAKPAAMSGKVTVMRLFPVSGPFFATVFSYEKASQREVEAPARLFAQVASNPMLCQLQ